MWGFTGECSEQKIYTKRKTQLKTAHKYAYPKYCEAAQRKDGMKIKFRKLT